MRRAKTGRTAEEPLTHARQSDGLDAGPGDAGVPAARRVVNAPVFLTLNEAARPGPQASPSAFMARTAAAKAARVSATISSV